MHLLMSADQLMSAVGSMLWQGTDCTCVRGQDSGGARTHVATAQWPTSRWRLGYRHRLTTSATDAQRHAWEGAGEGVRVGEGAKQQHRAGEPG